MNYAIPIAVLILTIVAFFGIARGRYADFGAFQIILRVIAALPLLVSGIFLHFLHASLTAGIIPPIFPEHLLLVITTGIFEIAGAIGLFIPKLRRAAALCIAIMMVAVVPANIYVAGKNIEGLQMPGIVPRIAMQVVYIVLVLLAGYGIPGRTEPSANPGRN